MQECELESVFILLKEYLLLWHGRHIADLQAVVTRDVG